MPSSAVVVHPRAPPQELDHANHLREPVGARLEPHPELALHHRGVRRPRVERASREGHVLDPSRCDRRPHPVPGLRTWLDLGVEPPLRAKEQLVVRDREQHRENERRDGEIGRPVAPELARDDGADEAPARPLGAHHVAARVARERERRVQAQAVSVRGGTVLKGLVDGLDRGRSGVRQAGIEERRSPAPRERDQVPPLLGPAHGLHRVGELREPPPAALQGLGDPTAERRDELPLVGEPEPPEDERAQGNGQAPAGAAPIGVLEQLRRPAPCAGIDAAPLALDRHHVLAGERDPVRDRVRRSQHMHRRDGEPVAVRRPGAHDRPPARDGPSNNATGRSGAFAGSTNRPSCRRSKRPSASTA